LLLEAFKPRIIVAHGVPAENTFKIGPVES
jgi:hypothetical protein